MQSLANRHTFTDIMKDYVKLWFLFDFSFNVLSLSHLNVSLKHSSLISLAFFFTKKSSAFVLSMPGCQLRSAEWGFLIISSCDLIIFQYNTDSAFSYRTNVGKRVAVDSVCPSASCRTQRRFIVIVFYNWGLIQWKWTVWNKLWSGASWNCYF